MHGPRITASSPTHTHTPDAVRAPLTVQRAPDRRWLEYSFSASIMLFGIAIVAGIRDENTLSSLFVLCFTTMLCGLLTEAIADTEIGKSELKWKSPYHWRMIPLCVGLVPYVAAWSIIISYWIKSIDDVCERLRDRIPDYVPYIIYGCFFIFSLFAVVLVVYQRFEPARYWETEVWYCILSLTAKVFLGAFLLTNVIGRDQWDASASKWDPSSECAYPPSSPHTAI